MSCLVLSRLSFPVCRHLHIPLTILPLLSFHSCVCSCPVLFFPFFGSQSCYLDCLSTGCCVTDDPDKPRLCVVRTGVELSFLREKSHTTQGREENEWHVRTVLNHRHTTGDWVFPPGWVWLVTDLSLTTKETRRSVSHDRATVTVLQLQQQAWESVTKNPRPSEWVTDQTSRVTWELIWGKQK